MFNIGMFSSFSFHCKKTGTQLNERKIWNAINFWYVKNSMDKYDSLTLSNLYSKGIFGSKGRKYYYSSKVTRFDVTSGVIFQSSPHDHLCAFCILNNYYSVFCGTFTISGKTEINTRFFINTNLSTIYDFPLL